MNKQKIGRPRITPVDDPLIVSSMKLTRAQWDKFKEIGGVKWLRKQLDRKSKQ
jgi:hypothetical protein